MNFVIIKCGRCPDQSVRQLSVMKLEKIKNLKYLSLNNFGSNKLDNTNKQQIAFPILWLHPYSPRVRFFATLVFSC